MKYCALSKEVIKKTVEICTGISLKHDGCLVGETLLDAYASAGQGKEAGKYWGTSFQKVNWETVELILNLRNNIFSLTSKNIIQLT
jgi:hypothetical protein